MNPLYFDPLDSSGNFIGTNPLQPTGIPIRTNIVDITATVNGTGYAWISYCFDPSLYQSYTFFSYPYTYNPTTYLKTNLLGTFLHTHVAVEGAGRTKVFEYLGVSVYENYSTQIIYFSQYSTFYSTFANFYQIDPVTFSIRFGTELQTLYASTAAATNFIATYENLYTEQIYWYNLQSFYYIGSGTAFAISSSLLASGLYFSSVGTFPIPQPDGMSPIGSSTFVNMLGSNVYSALLDTTNSVIIYQNEQISTYYSQSLSYQINIVNLTAALNSVSHSSTDNGQGTITVTFFSWAWESTPNGWTGSQVTDFKHYTYKQTVNEYLYFTYGGTVITSTATAITNVQALISIQNNNLANAQTFLNNAVSTLQSQVSLAGQIITALASGMETLINDI